MGVNSNLVNRCIEFVWHVNKNAAYQTPKPVEELVNFVTKEIEVAITDAEELIKSHREVLLHYADQSCEGWCKQSLPNDTWDCGGCRARIELQKN